MNDEGAKRIIQSRLAATEQNEWATSFPGMKSPAVIAQCSISAAIVYLADAVMYCFAPQVITVSEDVRKKDTPFSSPEE
jgi:hypothetical protein